MVRRVGIAAGLAALALVPAAAADRGTGTRGDDRIDGGAGRDRLDGGRGDDVVRGFAGHDWLDGGDGDDRVLAGPGHDFVLEQHFATTLCSTAARETTTSTGAAAAT